MPRRWRSMPALFAGAAVAALLSWTAPARAAEPSWETVQAEAARGGYRLINTDELRERLLEAGTGLLVIDTRQEWEYRAGHIAGAVSFPVEPTRWGRFKARRGLRRLLGPKKERPLVFY